MSGSLPRIKPKKVKIRKKGPSAKVVPYFISSSDDEVDAERGEG